ncbi:hypothetical protein DENSPDRAFT_162490 [Dentipellis sp. KUC8613]|nr:hypothetical protein DENSPDRAFT_162490 [Dentipellis sp. KUC8613]
MVTTTRSISRFIYLPGCDSARMGNHSSLEQCKFSHCWFPHRYPIGPCLNTSLPYPILAMVYYPPSFPLEASEILYVPGNALDPVTFHVLLAFVLIAFAIALLGVLRQKWSPSELLRALQAVLVALCDGMTPDYS